MKLEFSPYIDFQSPELKDLSFYIKGEYSCTIRQYGLVGTKNIDRRPFIMGKVLGKDCVNRMIYYLEDDFASRYHGFFITNLQVWVEVSLNGLVLTKVNASHAAEFDALRTRVAVIRKALHDGAVR